MRPTSTIAPGWWDFTTLDRKILDEAAKLAANDLPALCRDGFAIRIYDTMEDFYQAEAMEYVSAWRRATEHEPVGVCGPVGPIKHLPLVARIINEFEMDLRYCHFWGMDEWVVDGKEVDMSFPLSLASADMELCFNRIRPDLRMPLENIHFPKVNNSEYLDSWNRIPCVLMQGGQGDIKHWAFNDPPKREGVYVDKPPASEEYRKLGTRIVELHPMTIIQCARKAACGMVHTVPRHGLTIGPKETWKAEKVSIWHQGTGDSPFGMRLTTLMISQRIVDTSVPISLLADHPNVQFNFLRTGIGTCEAGYGRPEMVG